MPAIDEATALAWLCTQLPELRANADQAGWRQRLDTAEQALRAGTPPTEILKRLGIDTIDTNDTYALRGTLTPATITDLGIDPVPTTGTYTCPHGYCPRQAHPDHRGRTPHCADGTPMHPTNPR